jgi:hypothetical protein
MASYAAALGRPAQLAGYARRCVVIVAGANTALHARVLARRPQLGAVTEYPAGVIALSAACGRSPAAP